MRLVGGTGDDVIRAAANDVTFFVPGDGDDTLEGAGHGWNVVRFPGVTGGLVVDLSGGTAHGQGDDVLDQINIVIGSGDADVVLGNEFWSVLIGRGGGDVLIGGGGRDLMTGGDGDDRVDGGPGNDKMFGDRGRDVLFGRAGNDELVEKQGPEPNLILGGTGRDQCRGGYRVPPNIERSCENHAVRSREHGLGAVAAWRWASREQL